MAEAKPRLTVAREGRVDANRRVSNRVREPPGKTKTEARMNLLSVLCPKRDSLHSVGVARRREPQGEQQGERNAGGKTKTEEKDELALRFVPQAGLAS